jgi:uncharacterized protein (DUF934 family)
MRTDDVLAPRAQVIRVVENLPAIVEDTWRLVRDGDEAAALMASGAADVRGTILPVAQYLERIRTDAGSAHELGAWIAPDADFESYATLLRDAPLIAVD